MQNHIYETDLISSQATIGCVCVCVKYFPTFPKPTIVGWGDLIWKRDKSCVVWRWWMYAGEGCEVWRPREIWSGWEGCHGLEKLDLWNKIMWNIRLNLTKVALLWKIWIWEIFCNYPLQLILRHEIEIDNLWRQIRKKISFQVIMKSVKKSSASRITQCLEILALSHSLMLCRELNIRI